MSGRVEGKVALVTGAARGQGRSHALRLAQEGADIIAVDLCAQVDSVPYEMATPGALAETVRQVETLDRRIVAREADVREFAALAQIVTAATTELGRLDIVVANAGISSFSPAVEMDEQVWRDMIDVNLTGVWQTVKAAVPHIRAGGRGGSIVLTSSVAGLKPYANVAHYVAAKHGVIGLMKTLALELASDMIRVNTVNPTQVPTPMIMNDPTKEVFVPDVVDPTDEHLAQASQALQVLPIPWVEAVDVSNAILFLSSDEARYITGVALPIDAGALIK
jgi:(+)-trans-carveol dehydrogenase